MYKMVAVDLDDTLLNDEFQVTDVNRETIRKVLELGIKVCIVSGRSYGSFKKYIKDLGINHLCGSLNGANVTDPRTDKRVFGLAIDSDICYEILKVIEPLGIHVNYYHDQKVVCSEKTQHAIEYMKLTGTEIEFVGALKEYHKKAQAGKLLLIDTREKLDTVRQSLSTRYRDRVNFCYSKPNFLEAFNIHTSKGQAVKFISEHYGIKPEEIIAIGDGENDIAMLEFAGLGITLANSSDKVKSKADYITTSNNESGVAFALKKFIFTNMD